ncbi:phage tail protein [Pseudomonas syringae]|nr:phage tail protein [Pseudomonas syringae]MCF5070903.1 phage tail protein [Pseudomonas syringae]
MKEALLREEQLTKAKSELFEKNDRAAVQISRIQDRVETIGYGVALGEATEEDKSELVDLTATLEAWKSYKYKLGKVTGLVGWFESPAWPTEPPVPEIAASPMLAAPQTA